MDSFPCRLQEGVVDHYTDKLGSGSVIADTNKTFNQNIKLDKLIQFSEVTWGVVYY